MFGLQAMPTAAAVAAAAATAKIQALDAVATNLGLVRFFKLTYFGHSIFDIFDMTFLFSFYVSAHSKALTALFTEYN